MSTKGGAKKASPPRKTAIKPKPTPPDAVESEATDMADEIQKAVDVLTETFGELTPIKTNSRNFKTFKALDKAMDTAFDIDANSITTFALNGIDVMKIASVRSGALDITVHSENSGINESVARIVWQFEIDTEESEAIDPDDVSDWTKPWSVTILTEVYDTDAD
jgi:hypothetical protein